MAHDHLHDDELQPKMWTYAVIGASVPLFWMGNYVVGLCFVLIGLLYTVAGNLMTRIPEEDQCAIRYNIWSADDVVADLLKWQAQSQSLEDSVDTKQQKERYHAVTSVALAALAKKFCARQRQKQLLQQSSSASSTKKLDDDESNQMSLCCQEAVYMSLKSFGECDDAVVAASFALLALVAKSDGVRERHLQQADAYGLDVIVECMKKAMIRSQEYDNVSKEQEAAELQRKACLMLGALSDGNADIARQVVEEGGLKAVLNACTWYRVHEEVANWALWAVFILCYENAVNKVTLVEEDGIPIVLQTMKNCPDSVEVARHGTAILFDLLREQHDEAGNDHPRLDVWKIRNTALVAGLHESVVHAMMKFSGNANMDIMMMGREILVKTGYLGVIPEPQMSFVQS
jgi:hypothetical protein